jgi:hypothetical protein
MRPSSGVRALPAIKSAETASREIKMTYAAMMKVVDCGENVPRGAVRAQQGWLVGKGKLENLGKTW